MKRMESARTNRELAELTLRMFFSTVPRLLRRLLLDISGVVIEPRLRTSVMLPKPSWLVATLFTNLETICRPFIPLRDFGYVLLQP